MSGRAIADAGPAGAGRAERWRSLRSWRRAGAGVFALGAGVLVLALPLLVPDTYTMRVIDIAVLWGIYALSLNLLMGYVGLINLGQAAFLAVGAYSTAILTTRLGWSFWATLPVSTLAGAMLGAAVGMPSLRIGGHYLAMVTLGFGVIVNVFLVNLLPVTNGYDGIGGIPAPVILGLPLSNLFRYYYLLILALAVVAAGIRFVRHSAIGRSLLAIREDEATARALGVRTLHLKTFAFMWCAAIAALVGSLYASLFGYISPDSFAVDNSILVLAMVLVGGLGSIAGAILGALVLTLLPEYLRFLGGYYQLVYATIIILTMLLLPNGLVGMFSRLALVLSVMRGRRGTR